jgi:hypothetical protein
VGTPWFMAGEECTFDKCELSYVNNQFTPSYEGALLGWGLYKLDTQLCWPTA